ncbi:hypothetical protein BGW38_002468 [Lunasporangiospora selenospora]|uniref:Uncharacterized protein n=1 Tax=Lunasporangiospora selenospora TaxID=979761 RepID=A0A9P6G1R5_9FUNG|nr:hypothetical protein BGW38_002468 [Lunasporangiospora selenospora]
MEPEAPSKVRVSAPLDRSSEESHLRFTPELSDILIPGMGTVELLSSDETERQKRRRRRKKKKLLQGPGPVQSTHFVSPTMDPQSVYGFSLKHIDAPWRHLMTYTLQWETGHGFIQQFGRTSKDVSDLTSSSTVNPAQRSHEISAGTSLSEPLQSLKSGSSASKSSLSLTPPSGLRGPLTMDIHLVPLDTAKTSELVLSRIPVSVGQVTLQLRTEVPTGWYRLLINFWDEGISERPREARQKKLRPEPWDLSTSRLISGPGKAKINSGPRQVGLWRGADAIEVTNLDMANGEWREFVDTLSQETMQERIGSTNELWRKAELRRSIHSNQKAMQGFRPFVDSAGPQKEGWGHWISAYVRPWLPTGDKTGDGSNLSIDDGKASNNALESTERAYRRTQFDQTSFRFKEALNIVVERDLYPDYTQEELEEMEGELVEKRQQLAQDRKNNKNDPHFSQKDKAKDPAYVQKQSTMAARLQLRKALGLWGEQHSDSREVGKEDKRQPKPSPRNLKIRIENGKVAMPVDAVVGWRANRERTVSWEVTDELVADGIIMDIELIKVLSPVSPVRKNDWQHLQRADPAASEDQKEEHRDLLHQGSSQPKVEKAQAFVPQQLQLQLQQQHLSRAALLTDHIPGHWGAMLVRIPAWVDSGAYQIRLSGVGRQRVQWEDVSQPFWVHSDPYLYIHSKTPS